MPPAESANNGGHAYREIAPAAVGLPSGAGTGGGAGTGEGAGGGVRGNGGGSPSSVTRNMAVVLMILGVTTLVYASCPSEPLARVIIFIPPLFRLGQSVNRSFAIIHSLPFCYSCIHVYVNYVRTFTLMITLEQAKNQMNVYNYWTIRWSYR